MSENSFDAATAVRPVAPGRYAIEIDRGWTIGPGIPNGGYLLALLGRAALAEVADGPGHPHPLAANVQYVAPPATEAAEVDVEVLRGGRFASQARARLVQDGQARVEALFTLGTLHPGSEPRWGAVPPVELPPEDECRRLESMAAGGPSLRDVMQQRFDPATLGWIDGVPSGGGELRAWFRFADGRTVDPLGLLFVVDAIPPATFDIAATGWVPTLNLTAYIRAVPEPGPLRMRIKANVIADGVVDEVCEVWDSAGRLVAQSTQLAGIRLPESAPGSA